LKLIYPDCWQWIMLARRIRGELTERESNVLFQLARMRTPPIDAVIVELEPGQGSASLLLAAGLMGKTRPQLISVPRAGCDPAEQDAWRKNLERCGLDEIAEEGTGPFGACIDILFVNATMEPERLESDLESWTAYVKAGGLVVLREASGEASSEKLQLPQYYERRRVGNLAWAVKQCGPSLRAKLPAGDNPLEGAIEAMLHFNTMPASAEEGTRIAAARLQDYMVRAAREIAEERHAVEALRRSWSWRITAVLRRTVDVLATATGLLAPGSRISGITQWIRYRKQLRASGLLDERYYRNQNSGVAWAGASPLLHFLVCGAKEGRNPNELFDVEYYVRRYPEVADSGLNPLVHYLMTGAYEGRDPHPHFDSTFYLEQNPDVREAGLNPLAHYLAPGIAESRDPNPWFDTSEYLEQNPDVATFGLNPLTHQLKQAGTGGRSRRCSRW
jgi:hypothetical protein